MIPAFRKKRSRASVLLGALLLTAFFVSAPGVDAASAYWTAPFASAYSTSSYSAPAGWGTGSTTCYYYPACSANAGAIAMGFLSAAKGEQNNQWAWRSVTGTGIDWIGNTAPYYPTSSGTKTIVVTWYLHGLASLVRTAGGSDTSYATVDITATARCCDRVTRVWQPSPAASQQLVHFEAHGHDSSYNVHFQGTAYQVFTINVVHGHTYFFELSCIGYTWARGGSIVQSQYNSASLDIAPDNGDGHGVWITQIEIQNA